MAVAQHAETELAAVFASMARKLDREATKQQTLQQVVELAPTVVHGADHAGVTVQRRGKRLESPAYSDPRVLEIDRAQFEENQGPSLENVTDEPVLIVPDMLAEQRWPRFARRTAKLGVRSMVTCQLLGERGTLGSLNLYAETPGAFDESAIHAAVIYSAHAALAMSQAALVDSLSAAIESRQTIGEATGLLMERYGVTSPQAFQMLVQASQHMNVKLRHIAAMVVEKRVSPGDLPPQHAGDGGD
ncbi:ANTAR domain-containing protein [Streptomyces armeniacus]|uniref:ANTAR domain-containing protein n=1 Tax=Streptomyces armeniacus TaxID=83291 RepID=A0A345XR04_9ACTN|nr:GAF and ANTAR domain-containing protein [Streptomyces armeniacus]AXK34070.1 ANTAR domain-containing protein [Streptomyces armeniacus]